MVHEDLEITGGIWIRHHCLHVAEDFKVSRIFLNESGENYIDWCTSDSWFRFSAGIEAPSLTVSDDLNGDHLTVASADVTDLLEVPIIRNTDGDTVTIQDNLSVTGDLDVTGNITFASFDTVEIYNSAGDLKIQPDVTGDVVLFGDTQVANNENSPYFYLHRKAPEGNTYIRIFINSSQRAYFHGSPPGGFYMQGQVDMGVKSVTADVVLQVGDNAGAKKIRFQDSDNNDVATIDSNGVLNIDANTGGYLKLTRGTVSKISNYFDSTYTDLRFEGTKDKNRIGTFIDKDFQIVTNSFPRITIDNTGLVGIGTDNPQLPLDVQSEDDNQALFLDTTSQAAGVGGGIAFGGKYTDAGAEAMSGRIGTQKTNGIDGDVGFDMVLETQNSAGTMTQRAIFTSDGKVGINVTPFESPTKTLDVFGDTRVRGDLTINGIVTPLQFASVAEAKINFYSDTYVIGVESSELRIASNGKITFRTDGYNGTADVTITDSGFVGIGTDVPHDNLHIVDASPSFILEESDANNSEKVWELTANGGMLKLLAQSDLYTATQTVMEIDRGGTSPTYVAFPNSKVGIGTDTISGKLTVDQSNAGGAIPVLTLDQGDVDQPFIEFLNGTVYGGKSGTNKYLKIKADGEVGYIRVFS